MKKHKIEIYLLQFSFLVFTLWFVISAVTMTIDNLAKNIATLFLVGLLIILLFALLVIRSIVPKIQKEINDLKNQITTLQCTINDMKAK